MKIGKLLLALSFFVLPARNLSNEVMPPPKLKHKPVMFDERVKEAPIEQIFPMPVIDPEMLKLMRERNKHRTELI